MLEPLAICLEGICVADTMRVRARMRESKRRYIQFYAGVMLEPLVSCLENEITFIQTVVPLVV